MTTYSLSALTNRMQGKSVTLGWDAVVFMNRAKVNSLLEQQYITRFNRESFLKRIFGAPFMTPDKSEYLEMSGLILSHPRLSFEKASLRNSRATATLDIVSGTVSYVRKGSNQVPGAILYSYVVSANQGFTLTMDIDLVASRGTVNEQGKVTVDIGDGYNCRCNLVNEDRAQETLGDFFKTLFLEQKPEDRVYELGMLDLRDVDLLAPRSFQIRTMATEEGRNRASDDYGEGAVVLLVRTKGNPKEGDDPAENALDYLIPNDRNPQTGKVIYSGSLVLASRVLFDWYIQYYLEQQIGNNLRFERESASDHVARSLRAIAGKFVLPNVYIPWDAGMANHYDIRNSGELNLKFFGAIPDQSLKVFCNADARCVLSWEGRQVQPFQLHAYNPIAIPPHRYRDFNIYPLPKVSVVLAPIMGDSDNSVVLKRMAESIVECPIDMEEFHNLPGDLPGHFEPLVIERVTNRILEKFGASFDRIELPEISVLSISNLLFPERNALQLTEARLPGDLLMVGHIDPKETTFTLDPLLPVVKAGDRQTFTIRQLSYRTSDVKWSVRGVDGSRAVGTITDGEYEAPAVSLLNGSAVRNVVTATYTDSATGKEVTASAMVVVVLTGLVVTPSMSLIPMSDRRDVHLNASSQKGGPFRWTPHSNVGSLVTNGADAVYTPPSSNLPEGTLQAVLFDVEDTSSGEKTVATVLLSYGNFALNVTPALHPGLRANDTALLKPPSPNLPQKYTWEIVAGEGTIDGQTGVFTAPSTITLPYSVVRISLIDEFYDFFGYSIIHLSDHAKPSEWYSLDVFEFEVGLTDPAPTVYANGLQQALVRVRVKPSGDAELSEDEYKSIKLVSAAQKVALPEVGEDGVPENNKWHYTETRNDFDFYPYAVTASNPEQQPNRPKNEVVKEFFVQTHSVENLRIAAMLRTDNYEPIYTNGEAGDGEANRKVINLVAVQPPEGGTVGGTVFTFGNPGEWPVRVGDGDPDDENDLTTLDYYFLKLLINQKQVAIKKVKFVGNSSMVKWESDTMLEEIHSITGYAMRDDKNDQGKTILHTDEILLRRLVGQLDAPQETVDPGNPVPEGQVLISLQRREYWRYDRYVKSDFDRALDLIVFDAYGNRHSVQIGFEGINRNKLRIVG